MSPQSARIEEPHEQAEAQSSSSPEIDLDQLRRLLLGYDDERLERLQGWLNDPAYRAAQISEVLPRAIRLRPLGDEQLGNAIAPALEEALADLVRRDPQVLSRALAPVILPALGEAVRRRLAEPLRCLRLSLTLPGIGWLVEAWRSGRSFAAIADDHTLRYRVEYALLFHRPSASMLVEVENPEAPPLSEDDREDAVVRLQEMLADSSEMSVPRPPQANKLAVVMEQGPRLALAAVVRGQEPSELRDRMVEALDRIHLERRHSLKSTQIDPAAFASARVALEPLLAAEHDDPSLRRAAFLGLLVVAAALAAAAAWFYA